jgi:multiple sugar transport system substrate-binding protein
MKKCLIVLMMVVFFSSLFTVPGFSKKLVIACWYNLADLGGWKEIVEAFKNKHPEVTEVEVQISSWDEFLPKILTQVASGTAPDVITVENQPFPEFVAKGVLKDLTDYLEKTKGFSKKDFFSHYIDRYSVKGRLYGIPWDCEPVACLFYNKKLFNEAGVAYPNDTWRWEQLLNAAQKLTKKQGDRVTQYGYDPEGNWQYFVYTNGGSLVDNIKEPTKCTLDSKRAIDGVQFYLDLMYKYGVSPSPAMLQASGATSVDLFLTGRVAMSYGGIWDAFFHPKEYNEMAGLTIAPAGPTGIRGYPTGGTAWTICATSKEPDLAWDWITFFMGLEGFKIQFKGSYKGALDVPAYIPSCNWYLSQKDLYLENLVVNKIAARYAIFNPFDPRWPEIASRYINPEMDLILRNQKPVAPTMKDIALNVTKALQSK